MNQFIVVGYYTIDTLYEKEAEVLRRSLVRHDVPHRIVGVPNQGSWALNTSYKPQFIEEMMEQYPELCIVYVDVDAEFLAYPTFFGIFSGDIGVYEFPWTEYRLDDTRKELLSGTLFFRNTEKVVEQVRRWGARCHQKPKTWDQIHLAEVLENNYDLLPPEYCKIFDKMDWCKDPVIVHYQASRRVRNRRGRLD